MNEEKKRILSRASYKAIKKYDHQQMEKFATTVYTNGYKAGAASVPEADLTKIEKVIRNTKGIGEVKAAAIIENINTLFKNGDEANESNNGMAAMGATTGSREEA